MKLNHRIIGCCLLLGLAFHIPMVSAESAWENPVIQGYGKVRPMPEAAVQPRPDREYKILFGVIRAGTADQVNPGLEHIARLINIFALAKVPPEKLKIVAVLHGPATAASLDDSYYLEKYQLDNPNLKLIDALKQTGVIVYVCGQALALGGCWRKVGTVIKCSRQHLAMPISVVNSR